MKRPSGLQRKSACYNLGYAHGPYRFFFYSADGGEPPHIHIERDNQIAKFWLSPIRLAQSGGFRRSDLRAIERLVVEHQEELIESWNEFFNL